MKKTVNAVLFSPKLLFVIIGTRNNDFFQMYKGLNTFTPCLLLPLLSFTLIYSACARRAKEVPCMTYTTCSF